ncbi:MAG: MFS transporter [Clostridiales bacterium]|nr:MFS transporter [Clostridiales bacterium]
MQLQDSGVKTNVYDSELVKKKYKYGNFLIFACFFLYSSMMAAKGVFGAEISEIIEVLKTDETKASMANTYYFFTYGIMQVLLSIFMSKLNIKWYLLITLPIAATFSGLMGIATKIEHMWLFFGAEGIFHAGIWGGIIYILTKYVPKKLMSKGNRLINMGYATGTVVAYTLSAVCVTVGVWRLPFFILAGLAIAALIIFAIAMTKSMRLLHVPEMDFEEEKKFNEEHEPQNAKHHHHHFHWFHHKKKQPADYEPLLRLNTKAKKFWFYAVDMVMAFLLTAPYYAVMNWLTRALVVVHGLSQDLAIYVTIIAPIVTVIGPMLTISACDKQRNFIKAALFYALMLIPIAVALVFLYDTHWIVLLLLSAAFVCIANGVKQVVLSIVAIKLRTEVNAGSLSTISNAIASLAAGVIPTFVGAIIRPNPDLEVYNWTGGYITALIITTVAVLGILAIYLFLKFANKKRLARIASKMTIMDGEKNV